MFGMQQPESSVFTVRFYSVTIKMQLTKNVSVNGGNNLFFDSGIIVHDIIDEFLFLHIPMPLFSTINEANRDGINVMSITTKASFY